MRELFILPLALIFWSVFIATWSTNPEYAIYFAIVFCSIMHLIYKKKK